MGEHSYTNPIMPGFHPDPSVVRVGEDYYLVNSTFHHFPAIQISHSRDLVHWEYIGHGITDPTYIDFSVYTDHWGLWAPDISYHDGLFYIVFPMVNYDYESKTLSFENYIIHSTRAEGPYSRPVLLNTEGIDPSLFFDDDGTAYFLCNEGAKIARMNESLDRLEGPVKVLWEGTGRDHPEGPHLFKKDGWYYVMLAEGGTFYGHCVTIARSRSLSGPWQECPHNPILIQKDRSHPIQRAGHADMLQAHDGSWWLFYLVGRPTKDGKRSVLGRETALDPVTWVDDWPIVNGNRGPSIRQTAPSWDPMPLSIASSDRFTSPEVGLQWLYIRAVVEDGVRIEPERGCVSIGSWPEELDSPEARNVLLQRERHHSYVFEVVLDYLPVLPTDYAGITCWMDCRAFIQFGLTRSGEDGSLLLRLEENIFKEHRRQEVRLSGHEHSSWLLSVRTEGNRRTFTLTDRLSGEQWSLQVEDASYLCDDIDEHSGFTGTLVGMFNTRTDARPHEIRAEFSEVVYTEI